MMRMLMLIWGVRARITDWGRRGSGMEQEIVCLGGWKGTWTVGMMGRMGNGTLLGELGEWGTLEDCVY